jgi:hypothetical protein
MFHFILTDARKGFYSNRYKYLAFAIFFGIVLFECFGYYSLENVKPGLYDMLEYIFGGCMPFDLKRNPDFNMPLLWFILPVYSSFSIMSIAKKDINGYGVNMLLKSKNRTLWYVSKNIFLFLNTAAIYFISVVMICVSVKKAPDEKFVKAVLSAMISTFAIMCVQLFIEVFTKSIFGFLSSVIILLLTSFFNIKYVPGGISMTDRLKIFNPEGFFNYSQILTVCFCYFIAFLILGCVLFNRKDIFSYEK